MKNQEFKIGQKVIVSNLDEEGMIVDIVYDHSGFIAPRYRVKIGLDTENPERVFDFAASELNEWEYRRFVKCGNNRLMLMDFSKSSAGELVQAGTWGIMDRETNTIVMHITSPSSYWIVRDLCRTMNENNPFQKITG